MLCLDDKRNSAIRLLCGRSGLYRAMKKMESIDYSLMNEKYSSELFQIKIST